MSRFDSRIGAGGPASSSKTVTTASIDSSSSGVGLRQGSIKCSGGTRNITIQGGPALEEFSGGWQGELRFPLDALKLCASQSKQLRCALCFGSNQLPRLSGQEATLPWVLARRALLGVERAGGRLDNAQRSILVLHYMYKVHIASLEQSCRWGNRRAGSKSRKNCLVQAKYA